MTRAWFFVLILLTAIGVGVATAAEPSFPALTGRVVDDAQLLSSDARLQLETKLMAFETKTGRQLVVATLASLQGYEIEDYGYKLGRSWGIGEKGSNTGALLIVAPKERQVRIEVGYGLEAILTDAISRLIIENSILPRFREGDFSGGIERGVDDVIQVLTGDAQDFQRRATEQRSSEEEDIAQFVWLALILGLWLIFALRSQRRGARTRRSPWIIPIPAGRPSGGWSGSRGRGGF
jgi:uncharacterized protein